jgi:putative MATE family efflux protein
MFSGKYAVRIDFRQLHKFDRSLFARVWKVGFPSAIEQLVLRFGMLVFIKIAASLGTSSIAATQITFNMVGLTFMPGMAFSMAASTLVGQALGAGKPDLADKYGWAIRRAGLYVAVAVGIVFVLFPAQIVSLYTTEQPVIDQAALGIRIYGLIQVSQSTNFILAGALRGAGDTKFPLYSTFVGVWGVRVFVSLILVYVFHLQILGIWIAAALDQTARSMFIYYRYKKGNWKTIRV